MRTSTRLGAAVIVALAAARAQGALECNGFINISYPGAPPVQDIGDIVTVQIRLGTGTITGGPLNTLTIDKLGFDLACQTPPLPVPFCPPEGPVVAYMGDASIVSTCGGVITSNNPAGGPVPAHLTFQYTPPVVIPQGVGIPPAFCDFSFDIQILAQSTNPTGLITQVVSYDRAECDNKVLLSGGFQTGALPVGSAVGHFACYELVNAGLQPNIPVSLTDRFGSYALTLYRAHRLCAPASKDGGDPAAPSNPLHLVGYEFSGLKGNPVLATDVVVNNQFGSFTMDVRQIKRLKVPSSKSLVAPPAPPPPPGTFRHYACHNVDRVRGPDLRTRLTIYEDQFSPLLNPPGPATMLGFEKQSTWQLCVAVDKNGEEPDAPTDPTALLCLNPRDIRFPTVRSWLNNQFGPAQFGSKIPNATQLDEFCLPSTIAN